MGKTWRRINERLRQHIVAPHFQPASTERNQMMFKEASIYYAHFKSVIKKLTRLMKDYEDMNKSVNILLETRVPRLYTMETDGSVGAELHDGDAYLGTGFQMGRLTTSSKTFQTRLDEEVIRPIQQWFKNYDRCKSGLHSLEVFKFELDSRRRTVVSLGNRKTEFEDKVNKGDLTSQPTLSSTTEKLKHKESKYLTCLTEFQQKEEELNQSMRALLSEIHRLAELVGHIYQILSEVPEDAHRAFKEGTSSGVRPPILIASQKGTGASRKTETNPFVDNSNPFLTPR